MFNRLMKHALHFALSNTLSATGDAPEWILLVPAGEITTRDGRQFNNQTPDDILTSFAADQRDIPLDYEHATEVRAHKVCRHQLSAGSLSLRLRTVIRLIGDQRMITAGRCSAVISSP